MHLRDVMAGLKHKGFKNTPQRRAVIKALLQLGQQPTAKEIYDEVHKAFPDISLDTVYRNLNLLVDLGVVSQLNLRFKESSRYELSALPHHHHLICLSCGKAVCLNTCPIDRETLAEVKENDFEVVSHAFEIYGYCSGCKKVG